ncbi:uncharacterized protein C13orf46 homolog [Paroedura picta]|uniref:uncharacterized protein C13orf46 homolog n=1 Tax=Paroedura picta TaxID=143630 RepID=UPI0040561365
MKKHKTPKTPAIIYRRHLASMPFKTKPPPGTHRAVETPDLHKSKSVRLLGHSLTPELGGQIEKTLQEAEPSSTKEGAWNAEDDISCLKEIKKKVHESRKDKESDHKQEESAHKHTIAKQKDPALFVEIDLRDKVEEEKTEDISTEEKLLGKEEEALTAVSPSSWLCCLPIWMKQTKQKEKKE